MKRLTILAAVVACSILLENIVTAQTVATDPVGFNTSTVAAGGSTTVPKVAAFSLPFNSPLKFAGAVDASGGVTSNTIKTTGAGWTVNAFAALPANHVVRFLSGASIGRQFNITSNTTDTLTLATGTTNLTTVVAGGDRYAIIPLETLATLFGVQGELGSGLLTNADPTQADNVLLQGTSGYLTFWNDGTKWNRQGGSGSQNNFPVPVEQGFVLVRRSGTAYSFTALGAVPTTNLKTDFPANKLTIFGNRFPVATSLTGTTPPALNLQSVAGWNANVDPTLADNLLLRGTNGWLTFYYDGSQWLRSGATGAQNPTIQPGTAMIIVRRGGSTITLDQPLPYSLP